LGDGIWAGLRLYKGKWLFFDDHMERLYAALRAVEIGITLTKKMFSRS
tara:strand:- start:19 stop:162 length:144 start_codon:yes stop_codon:yes gene_type:complete